MSARMVIRDVGRALDISYADTDKLAKMIPNELHITIKKALEQNRELKELYENDETVKKIVGNCYGIGRNAKAGFYSRMWHSNN